MTTTLQLTEAAYKEAEETVRALERQLGEAKRVRAERFEAYGQELLRSKGLLNMIVEGTSRWGRHTTRFVAQGISSRYFSNDVTGPIVKKDGTLGVRMATFPIDSVIVVGPWQEGSEAAAGVNG